MNRDGVRRFFEAEVKCYHCGSNVGLIRRENAPGFQPTFFQARGNAGVRVVRSLASLRCARCAGSLYTEELDLVHRYDPRADPIERPRRGRPPKHCPVEEGQRSA
jgi:hypothetical protein